MSMLCVCVWKRAANNKKPHDTVEQPLNVHTVSHQLLSNKAVMQTIVDSFVPNIEFVVFCFVYCFNFFLSLFVVSPHLVCYSTLLKYLLGFSLSLQRSRSPNMHKWWDTPVKCHKAENFLIKFISIWANAFIKIHMCRQCPLLVSMQIEHTHRSTSMDCYLFFSYQMSQSFTSSNVLKFICNGND